MRTRWKNAVFLAFFAALMMAVQVEASGPPPFITVQPSDQTVQFGGTVTFTVTAQTGTTLTYQWYGSGKINGATNASLTVSNASCSSAGKYYVAVSNGGGTVNSTNVTLTVIGCVSADNSSSSATGGGGATALTWQHTVSGGSNGLLVVNVSTHAGVAVSSVTYGGVPFIQIGSVTNSVGSHVSAEIWCLKNPMAGTSNITVTLAAKDTFTAGATSFFGVNQAMPFGAFGSASGIGTNPSVTLASGYNQMVIDAVASRGVSSGTNGALQTQRWIQYTGYNGTDSWGGSSTESGPGTVTMSWNLAGSGSGEWASAAVSIAPNPCPPAISTMAASNVTPSSAIMNASANPQGFATKYAFQYGLGTSYGYFSATNALPAGTNAVLGAIPVAGLLPGTVYHYRAIAGSAGGTVFGQDATFTTAFPPPAVLTLAASSVMTTSAILNATLNLRGTSGTCFFRYGTTTNYGSFTITNSLSAGNSDVFVSISQPGLTPGTVYHFQAVVVTSGGTSAGGDVTLTSNPGAPSGSNLGASNVTATSAVLNGVANQQLVALNSYFQYGLDTNYGQTSSGVLIPALSGILGGSGVASVSIPITGLTPGKIYHYRLVVSGLSGNTYGPDATFATLSLTQPPLVNSSVGANPASGFNFQVATAPGQTYVVLASDDMFHWSPISTNIASSNLDGFTDPTAKDHSSRFYRVKLIPFTNN